MTKVYYNDSNEFCCHWLDNLVLNGDLALGDVDCRDIRLVSGSDLKCYDRCHFFAGVGGWEYALQIAGWNHGSVFTGSCPCQPFSNAGKGLGERDPRHLWPEFFRIISECRPSTIFGEQVSSKHGRSWLDGVFTDLEGLGYAVAGADLCAAGVNAPHIRQRLYWVAYSDIHGCKGGKECNIKKARGEQASPRSDDVRSPDWMGDSSEPRLEERVRNEGISAGERVSATWSSFKLANCVDGKVRRISSEPCDAPLAYGVPRDLGSKFPELRGLAKGARANRRGRLEGYGNAIVPQVAAIFIKSFLDTGFCGTTKGVSFEQE